MELGGKRHYVGPWGSPESKERYARLLAEWESAGHQEPLERDQLTVMELAARFWTFAEGYYRFLDGRPTPELGKYRITLKPLKELYGLSPARDFGPKALKSVREVFIERGACRHYVNELTGRIRRVFKWAVAEELLSPTVYQALQAVPDLKRGRSQARETQGVRPVPQSHIDAIEPYVSRQVWALIQLQLFTAARSGELVVLRPCDLEMGGGVWTYSPQEHKTAHHGHTRTIFMGPRAQEVLHPFLAGRGLQIDSHSRPKYPHPWILGQAFKRPGALERASGAVEDTIGTPSAALEGRGA